MRMRRIYRRRRRDLTPHQEKAQALRDITEIRAKSLCVGAAFNLSQCSTDLKTFDWIRDFINTEVAEAVTKASAAEKAYDESFQPKRKAGK